MTDLWVHDTCLVCNSKHSTPDAKILHTNDSRHKNKIVVHDFLSKELSCLTLSKNRSLLYERYHRADASIAGLDCICELNFSWTKVPMWACTICYVAGRTLESADLHLYSSYHKRNYINEYHPEKFADLIRAQEKSTRDKHSLIEHEAILKLLQESKGLMSPDVYNLDDRDKNWAYHKLGILPEEESSDYVAESVSDVHQIVLCYICGETFMAYLKEDEFREAWYTHLSKERHQRCKFIHTLVHEGDELLPREGAPPECQVRNEVKFEQFNGSDNYYGPTCGLDFLVMFNGSTESFCELCFCIIPNSCITEHFSSEYHIERFVRRKDPSKLLNVEFWTVKEIHECLVYCLNEKPFNSHRHMYSENPMPLLLKEYAFLEQRSVESKKMEEIDMGNGFKAIWCEDCKEYINIDEPDAWTIHVFDEAHYESATKRCLYDIIGNEGLVSSTVTLPKFTRSSPPSWEEHFSVTLGILTTQDHCEFGLRFIVKDTLNNKLLCTCCYVQCDEEDGQMFSYHARSLEHITKALHMMGNKSMITLAWLHPIGKRKEMVMDYLTHHRMNPRVNSQLSISVYDPALACRINCLTLIPKLLLELAKIAPEKRLSYLTSKKEELLKSKVDQMVLLNMALRLTRIDVRSFEDSGAGPIFFCQDCCQGFSSSISDVEDFLSEHLLGLSHWERSKAFRENPFDENDRLLRFSKIEVQPFHQVDTKKKVTWRWNDKKASYEFVYAIIGLEDIRERKNFKGEPRSDFFCTLCAQAFKTNKLELEQHIRSFTHIYYYVLKHHTTNVVGDLQAILLNPSLDTVAKHKNIRRLFARALKDYDKEKGKAKIPVYDFERRDCYYPEVKTALAEDDTASIGTTTCRKNCSLTFIDAESLEKNVALIVNADKSLRREKGQDQEVVTYLTRIVEDLAQVVKEPIIGQKVGLERAKLQLLNLNIGHFDGLVETTDHQPPTQSLVQQLLDDSRDDSRRPRNSIPSSTDPKSSSKKPNDDRRYDRSTSAASNNRTRERREASEERIQKEIRADKYKKKLGRTSIEVLRRADKFAAIRREIERPKTPVRVPARSRSPVSSRPRTPVRTRSPIPAHRATDRARPSESTSSTSTRPPSPRSSSHRSGHPKSARKFPGTRSPSPAYKRFHGIEDNTTRSSTHASKEKSVERQDNFRPKAPVIPKPPQNPLRIGGAYDPSYTQLLLSNRNVSPVRGDVSDLTSEKILRSPNQPATKRHQESSSKKSEDGRTTHKTSSNRGRSRSRSKEKTKRKRSRSKSPSESSSSTSSSSNNSPSETESMATKLLEAREKAKQASRIQINAPKQLLTEVQAREEQKRIRNAPGTSTTVAAGSLRPVSVSPDRDSGNDAENIDGVPMVERWKLVDGKFVLTSVPMDESPTKEADQQPSSATKVQAPPKVPLEPPGLVVPTSLMPVSTEAQQAIQQKAADVLARMAQSTALFATNVAQTQAQPIPVLSAGVPQARTTLPSVQPTPLANALQPTPLVPALQPTPLANALQATPLANVLQQPTPLASVLQQPNPLVHPAQLLAQPQPLLGPAGGLIRPNLAQTFPFLQHQHQQFSVPPPAVQPIMDRAEVVMHAKMQLYNKDLVGVNTVAELIEYMWKQGFDSIPAEDPPLLFNEVVKKWAGLLGASTLYQIICYGHPDLETYYCGMCNHWTTVSEIFHHLNAAEHRLNYLSRHYRKYHTKVLEEQDESSRNKLLLKLSTQIWNQQEEREKKCSKRMRCILNRDVIARLWPNYENFIDHSWKIMDDDEDFAMSMSRDDVPRVGLSAAIAAPHSRQNPPTFGGGTSTIIPVIPTSITPSSVPTQITPKQVLSQQTAEKVTEKAPTTPTKAKTIATETTSKSADVQMIQKASIEQIRGEQSAAATVKEKSKEKEHKSQTESATKKRDAPDRKEEDKSRAAEKERLERNSRSSRDRDLDRRERRRSRSRKRSRSPIRTSSSRRSRERDRSREKRESERKRDSTNEKRRRSRSRSRTRTSGRTRTRSPPAKAAVTSSSVEILDTENQKAPGGLDKKAWDQKAANFLARIGQADSRQPQQPTPPNSSNPQIAGEQALPTAAVQQRPAVDETGRTNGGGSAGVLSLEGRLARTAANHTPRQLSEFEARQMMEQLQNAKAQIRQSEPAAAPITQSPIQQPQRQESSMRKKSMDSSSEMRRAIAAMVELQSEYERTGGNLTAEIFFKICDEMGLPAENVMQNKMLCEAAVEFHVNLNVAFPDVRRQQQMAATSAGGDFNWPQTMAPPPRETFADPVLPPKATQVSTPQSQVPEFNLKSLGLSAEAIALLSNSTPGASQAAAQKLPSSSGIPRDELEKRMPMNYFPGQQPSAAEGWPSRNSSGYEWCSPVMERRQQDPGNSWPTQVTPNIQSGRGEGQGPTESRHFPASRLSNEGGGPVLPPFGQQPQHIPSLVNDQRQSSMRPPQMLGNPDIQRLVQAVGDDWNTLGQFSSAMLDLAGFGLGLGEQKNQSPQMPPRR